MRHISVCLVLVVLFAAELTAAEDQSVPDGTIYGHVYDAQTKQPVPLAFVYCQTAKCSKQTTDSEGYYAIENCFSPLSTYVIECTKNGYPSTKRTAKTDSAGKAEVNFNLGTMQNPSLKPDSNQTQVKSWKKTFSRSTSDIGWSVQQTNDGGYIIAARTSDVGRYGGAWLIKTDINGNELWNRTFRPSNYDDSYTVYSVKQTLDNGYIIAGDIRADLICVIKIDSFGNEQWNKTFGESYYVKCYSIQQTRDGGYIIAGSTVVENHDADVLLIKIDSQGNKLWERTFGGLKVDEAKAVLQTSDGGYILAGYTVSYAIADQVWLPIDEVGWLIKTDPEGNKLWDKTLRSHYTNDGGDKLNSIQLTNDGGYIAGGYARPANTMPSLWLVKIDPRGNKQWDDVFSCAGDEDIGSSVQQTDDGGYIIIGSHDVKAGDSNAWLIKTDANGNKLWEKTLGGFGKSVLQTSDGGFIIAGYAQSSDTSKADVVLIKTYSEGN